MTALPKRHQPLPNPKGPRPEKINVNFEPKLEERGKINITCNLIKAPNGQIIGGTPTMQTDGFANTAAGIMEIIDWLHLCVARAAKKACEMSVEESGAQAKDDNAVKVVLATAGDVPPIPVNLQ